MFICTSFTIFELIDRDRYPKKLGFLESWVKVPISTGREDKTI